MKIAVLIPDRGDRPKLLANCIRMMNAQTLPPAHVEIVCDPPRDNEKDITWRYRTGYERLRGKGFDVIAMIENDDWYSPNYLEWMIGQWQRAGKPQLFGTNYTIYYHILHRAWFVLQHPERASAMNTLIVPDLEFSWPVDNDPYTDIHLWMHTDLQKVIVFPPVISMGMKHLEGKHGGKNHIDKMERYINRDFGHNFLRSHLDAESFRFYSAYYG